MKIKKTDKSVSPEWRLDIVELMIEEHKPLRKLLAVMSDVGQPIAKRREIFETFAKVFAGHARPEERALYHFMDQEDNLRQMGLEGEAEHRLVQQMIGEVRAVTSEDALNVRMKILTELVEHHLEDEEKVVFPELCRKISVQLRGILADEYLIYQEETEHELARQQGPTISSSPR